MLNLYQVTRKYIRKALSERVDQKDKNRLMNTTRKNDKLKSTKKKQEREKKMDKDETFNDFIFNEKTLREAFT